MKNVKYFAFTIMLFFIAIFTVNAETMNLETDTRIKEENLRTCLISSYNTLNTLNKLLHDQSGSEGEFVPINVQALTDSDILALKKFSCQSSSLTGPDYPKKLNDLSGLEIFTGLTEIDISGTTLSSIDLSSFINLEKAYLSSNLLKSVTGLDKLTKLTVLGLSNNQLSSLTGLENTTNTMELIIEGNKFTHIKVGSNVTVYGDKQGDGYSIIDDPKVYNVVYKSGNNYYTNLSKFFGIDLSKVSNVSTGTYDSATGIINFGTTKPEKFTYSYDNGKLGVTVTLVDALSVKFYANGSKLTVTDKNNCSIDNDGNVVCQCVNGGSCTITTPKASKKNYVILGYDTTSSSTMGELKPNSSYVIEETKSYYAISKRELIINFRGNGATIDSSVAVCTWYSDSDTCYLQIPAITRDGFNIIGWSTDKNATKNDNDLFGIKDFSPSYDFSYSFMVNASFDESKIYYAITKKKVNVTFSQDDGKEENVVSCEIRNSAISCGVSAPKINVKDGYKVLGWATSKDSLEGIPVGEIINVKDDQTYYAITYDASKDIKTFVAKFQKNGADSIDLRGDELSCNTLGDSCTITAPSFKKDGYEILGWATTKNTSKAEYKPGDSIKLTKNMTLYAIYGEKLDTGTTENVDTGISSFIYVLVPIVLCTGVYLYTKKFRRI